jgi:cysteine desulfurase
VINWDHNATTPLRPEVAELLVRRIREGAGGNASSIHASGRAARRVLEDARAQVAHVLGAEPKEITFTGSGTEAAALCLKGAWFARRDATRTRVVVSAVEHPAVLKAAAQLERHGATVTRVPPEPDGRVDASRMAEALGPDVAVCSLMWANNETGVLQPVRELAAACRRSGVPFHVDAVQAVGKVRVNLREVNADLLTFSAHKFGGPPGVGVAVVRRGVTLEALAPGHQEDGRRGGTQDVRGAEATSLALSLADAEVEAWAARLSLLRDGFEARLRARLPSIHVHGADAPRVANTSNVRFDGADGEALLIALDLAGICVSTGAACSSGSLAPSHVLTAQGLSPAQAHASLRFSLGREATEDEVERVLATLCEAVPRSRAAP